MGALSVHAGPLLGGIGANPELTEGGVILRDIIPNSPAAKAGLLSGDVVRQANGVSLRDLGLQEVIPLLRGPVGSPVILLVDGEGIEQPTPVEVIRGDLTKCGCVQTDAWLGADAAALSQIQLPANPTKAQVTDYIAAIAAATKDQKAFSYEDPQIDMLAKVGAENLDALLAAPASLAFYVAEVAAEFASDANKASIIGALKGNMNLVRIIVERGWIADARSILIDGLRAHPNYLPSQWIAAVASLNDSSTYGDLTWYLINGQDRLRTYEALQKVPGLDLAAAVDAAWQKVNNVCNVANRTSLTPVALATGHADALGMAVGSLQRLRTDREWLPGDRQLLLQHTTATGTDAEIIQWYNQNKNNLVFDAATAKFRVAKS
ncbi:MAG TPA: PDZ domain-containing protein [Verrucomicrobiae bacterium]|nr:PDZ domain-containing protein [Verrucomicrobiae bacterium]